MTQTPASGAMLILSHYYAMVKQAVTLHYHPSAVSMPEIRPLAPNSLYGRLPCKWAIFN